MKIPCGVLRHLIIVLHIGSLVGVVGCATDYDRALSEGTEQAYRDSLDGENLTPEQKKAMRAKLAEFAFEQDTEEAYKRFLKYDPRHVDARIRLHELRYERALLSGLRADWEPLMYDYSKSTFDEAQSHAWEERRNNALEANGVLNRCDFSDRTLNLRSAGECLDRIDRAEFLKKTYGDRRRQEILDLMEPQYLANALKATDRYDYIQYLSYYPEGSASEEMRKKLEELLYDEFVKAPFRAERHTSSDSPRERSERYLRWFPDGLHAAVARRAIKYMDANRATPVIDHPQTVRARATRDSNYRFEWVTELRETSGHAAFLVFGVGYYVDGDGHRWMFVSDPRSRVDSIEYMVELDEEFVGPGDSTAVKRWISGIGALCGGRSKFIWHGSDSFGYDIELEEVVEFVCDSD